MLMLLNTQEYAAQVVSIDTNLVIINCPSTSVNLQGSIDNGTLYTGNYGIEQLPAFQPEQQSTGTVVNFSVGCNDCAQGVLPIGFDFDFYCNEYDEFWAFNTGRIHFTIGFIGGGNTQSLPSTALGSPVNGIFASHKPWGAGLSNDDSTWVQITGTAPNRKLVVSFEGFPLLGCPTDTGSYQIVLHETSNIVDIHLFEIPVCLADLNSGNANMGMQNLAGTEAAMVTGRNHQVWTASNESWRFTPAQNLWWISDQGDTLSNDSALSFVPSRSQWVYFRSRMCGDTIVSDSTHIILDCYDLDTNSFSTQCIGDSSGMAIASCSNLAFTLPAVWFWTDALGDTIDIDTTSIATDTLPNLPIGTYFVRVFDDAGISGNDSITIGEPDTGIAVMTGIDLLCFQDASGTATSTDTQNYAGITWSGNYGFTWLDANGSVLTTSNQTNASNVLSNLDSGTYSVIIDACVDKIGSITIVQPAQLEVSLLSSDSTLCAASCDGSAQVAASGGTGAYTYLWTSNEAAASATGLCSGVNAVTVTDANGCDSVLSVMIGSPLPVLTSVSSDTTICTPQPASLVAGGSGGSAPFSFQWFRDFDFTSPLPTSTAQISVTLMMDTDFQVVALDAHGCRGDTSSVLVSLHPALMAQVAMADTACPNIPIALSVMATGGDGNYTYTWQNGTVNDSVMVTVDSSSFVFVTVTDNCGSDPWLDSTWVQVGGYDDISVSLISSDDSICPGQMITILASATGGFSGSSAYHYDWNIKGDDTSSIEVTPDSSAWLVVTVTDECLSNPGSDSVFVTMDAEQPPRFAHVGGAPCTNHQLQWSLIDAKDGFEYQWFVNNEAQTTRGQVTDLEFLSSESGCLNVRVDQWTEFGCLQQTEVECALTLISGPMAQFVTEPAQLTNIDRQVLLNNSSRFSSHFEWYVDSVFFSDSENPILNLLDTGTFSILLVAGNNLGCKDSLQLSLEKAIPYEVFIPSAFSPNGDQLNETFHISTDSIQRQNFSIIIFDRQGQVIFSSTDKNFQWKGPTNTVNNSQPFGYSINYVDYRGREVRKNGIITLVK